MLIKSNIPIDRVLSGTWQNLFFSFTTSTIAYWIDEWWLSKHFNFPGFIPTILGTALAFFIGFNNNQAYDRWWEGRKVWGGLVNSSRTWARMVINYTSLHENISPIELKIIQERLVKRQIAFVYALKDALRDTNQFYYQLYISGRDINAMCSHSNIQNALLSLQSYDIQKLYKKGVLDGFQFMEMSKTITALCDEMGKAERIKSTVFPTTYTYYSRYFIWIFIFSATMTMGDSIGLWAIVFGTLTGYVFFTIQSLGLTLVNPFETLSTSLPLNAICRTIEINLLQTINYHKIPEPIKPIRNEYIL